MNVRFLERPFLCVAVLFAGILNVPTSAQATTYTYAGNLFQTIGFSSPLVCPVTGSFTTTEPLPPNSNTNLKGNPLLEHFSLGNCFNTVTDQNQDSSFEVFSVATDSDGKIQYWVIGGVLTDLNVVVTPTTGESFTANAVTIFTSNDPLAVLGEAEVADITEYNILFQTGAANSNVNSPGVWTGGTGCVASSGIVPTSEKFEPSLSGFIPKFPGSGNFVGYGFTMSLNGGNFQGCKIRETDVPGGSSSCSTLNGPVDFKLSDSQWDIGADNIFTDHVATAKRIIRSVRADLSAHGQSSCLEIVFQQMQIFSPETFDWLDYGPVNRLEIKISLDGVMSSRTISGVDVKRRQTWP